MYETSFVIFYFSLLILLIVSSLFSFFFFFLISLASGKSFVDFLKELALWFDDLMYCSFGLYLFYFLPDFTFFFVLILGLFCYWFSSSYWHMVLHLLLRYFDLLASSFTPWWSKKMHVMSYIFFKTLLRLVLWPIISPVTEKVACTDEM